MGLVALLFGVSGRATLPGPFLVGMLGEFGLTPAAARQQLHRMRGQGQLDGERVGRATHYRLAGTFAARSARLRDDRGATVAWPGHFHALLHQVPERHRAYRDRLRRLAGFVGYAPMQPGVLIAVADRADELAEVLDDVPPGAAVHRARLGMDADDAARVAATAWELPTLAADLRAHLAALRALVDEPDDPPPTAASVRRLAEHTNQVYVDLLRDPGLPPALRPPDWPGDDVRRALGALAARYLAPVRAHLDARLAAHGG